MSLLAVVAAFAVSVAPERSPPKMSSTCVELATTKQPLPRSEEERSKTASRRSPKSLAETEMRAGTLTRQQQQIFEFHRRLHDAHWRGDTPTLRRFLTQDWFVINPSGEIVTRDQFLKSANAGDSPRLQDEFRIRMFGDVAVMTLRTTWADGRAQRGTEVFVRKNGAWLQAANQQTLVRPNACVSGN